MFHVSVNLQSVWIFTYLKIASVWRNWQTFPIEASWLWSGLRPLEDDSKKHQSQSSSWCRISSKKNLSLFLYFLPAWCDLIQPIKSRGRRKIIFWCHFDRREKLLSSEQANNIRHMSPAKTKAVEEYHDCYRHARLLLPSFSCFVSNFQPLPSWRRWINVCFWKSRLRFMGNSVSFDKKFINFPYVHFHKFFSLFAFARS